MSPGCFCLSCLCSASCVVAVLHNPIVVVVAMPGQTVAPSWEKDVWSLVGAVHKRLEAKPPAGFTSAEHTEHLKTIAIELGKTGEVRGDKFNLAWLNPCSMSIPGDVMCTAKAEKAGRYHFWDQEKDMPRAPPAWPRSQNIPLASLSQDIITAHSAPSHPPSTN